MKTVYLNGGILSSQFKSGEKVFAIGVREGGACSLEYSQIVYPNLVIERLKEVQNANYPLEDGHTLQPAFLTWKE